MIVLSKLYMSALSIRPRSVWPAHRDPKTSSRKGYLREQFVKVWGAYCPAAGTTAQSNKVKYLDRHNVTGAKVVAAVRL